MLKIKVTDHITKDAERVLKLVLEAWVSDVSHDSYNLSEFNSPALGKYYQISFGHKEEELMARLTGMPDYLKKHTEIIS